MFLCVLCGYDFRSVLAGPSQDLEKSLCEDLPERSPDDKSPDFLLDGRRFLSSNARVETLGLSGPSPRSESRLKSLFWPQIENGSDVDYLGAQGHWVCTLVAVVSFIFLIVAGKPISAIVILLFYYLGGVGVRERSRYAAAVVFAMYLLDTLLSPGVLRVLFAALLLSNLRATWIASGWKPGSEESFLPPRLNESWTDKFRDRLPGWLWPKTRIFYYIFSAAFLLLAAFGVVMMLLGKIST